VNNPRRFDIDAIRKSLLDGGLGNVTLKELEAAAIRNAMQAANGDREQAAEMLGIAMDNLALKLDGLNGSL